MNSKKKVIYIGGGAMAGVFSAGVMTSLLEDKDIFNKIEAVYASSAGAFVAAYFLAGQPEGASIFYDDLITNFITPKYVAYGTYDRFINKFIKTVPVEKMRNPINLDYALNVVRHKKKLDVATIAKRNIPFNLHLFDTKSMSTTFVDFNFKKDPIETLGLAANAVPYFFPVEMRYVDGEIANYFPIETVMADHPDKEIMVILNIIRRRFFRRLVKSFLEGVVASLMYSHKIVGFYLRRDLEKEYKKHKTDRNIRIVAPDKNLNLWPDTVDRKILLNAYEAGKVAGLELLKNWN